MNTVDSLDEIFIRDVHDKYPVSDVILSVEITPEEDSEIDRTIKYFDYYAENLPVDRDAKLDYILRNSRVMRKIIKNNVAFLNHLQNKIEKEFPEFNNCDSE